MGKERKEQPHAQSFKGMCGNSYGKGGREAHVGLPSSDPDVQAAALMMPVKGSRACWARQYFLNYQEAREISGWLSTVHSMAPWGPAGVCATPIMQGPGCLGAGLRSGMDQAPWVMNDTVTNNHKLLKLPQLPLTSSLPCNAGIGNLRFRSIPCCINDLALK